ncbi:17387_t:CDS:2, partial [Gigaspora margarita]
KATRIMPETNKLEESKLDNELKDEMPEVNNVILPIVTKDILTDDSIIKVVLDKFCNNYNNDDNNVNNEPPPLPITHTELLKHWKKL